MPERDIEEITEETAVPIRTIAALILIAFTVGGWAVRTETRADAQEKRLDVQRDKQTQYQVDISSVKSDLRLIKYKLGIRDEKE